MKTDTYHLSSRKSTHRHFLLALVMASMATLSVRGDYVSTVLGDHPIAYYPLYLTNSTAVDLSGNANNGAFVNISPGVNNVPGPSAFITNAVSFDGLSTYVDLSGGPNVGLLNFGGIISMEAWAQANGPSENGYILGKGYDSTANGDEIVLRCPGFGVYQGGTFNFTTGDVHATGGTVTTNWVHLVCTYDGTNWNLYANGAVVGVTPDTSGALNFSTSWAIGDGTADGGTRIFTGNITHVAIYTNALTSAQVQGHYLAGIYGTANIRPVILAQPSPQVASPGGNVAFSVQVLSALPVTNQWYKDGSPISGATNLTLTLNNVQTTSSGNYTVIVGNSAGTTNSMPANLLVLTPGVYGVSPVPIAASSYNYDTIVENSAIPSATTASLDGGTNNIGYSWYETGFSGQSTTGLPAPGSTIVSAAQPDHSYTMAPSYTANNAFLLDSSVSSATIHLTSPAAYSGLSFLMSSGGGGVTVNYTVHHADSTTETGSITSPDWFSGTTVALNVNGRVDVRTRSFQSWGSGGPTASSQDVSLSDTGSAVTSIDLAWGSGGGNACILAISGSSGASFNPIAVTGYNEDMIVEAAAQGFVSDAYTTASMDNSIANTGFAWYEDGFEVPGRGVPQHGSTITSQAQSDHSYTFAPSYTANDVVLVDSVTSNSITLLTPAKMWRLSFLTAAGHGPVNVNYVVHHADGSSEPGTFSSPDWFGSGTVAWAVNGRVDAQSGNLQTWGSGGPKLCSVDVAVTNIASAVTNIALSFGAGNQNGSSAEVLAVSGAYIDQSHMFTGVKKNANGTVTLNFAGVPGYKYIAQFAAKLTPPVVWQNIGTNSASSTGVWQFTDTNAPGHPIGFYRSVYLP
jgi:hypothetical protein